MLPIAEVRPWIGPRARPRPPAVVVGALIIANIAAFIYEQALIEAGARDFTLDWGLIPRVMTRIDTLHGVETIFTSMFLHGGWVHLLGNLWFLFLFGRSVEEALGSVRFSALYLLSGVAAAITQVVVSPNSIVPMIGASGAIGGVLGAYVSLYPGRRIKTVFPIFIFPLIFAIPSIFIMAEWFVLNLFQGIGTLQLAERARGGVAVWAHVGGFLAGLVLVRTLFPERPAQRRIIVRAPDYDAPYRRSDG